MIMDVKLVIFIYILLFPTVFAGEGRTFELDFNTHKQYDLFLEKSDRILFEYGGYNNTIIIDEIKNQSAELDLFLFLESGLHTPDYQFLTKKYELRLDFDKDGKRELSINLLNINKEKNIVNILFRRLDDWNPDAVLDLPELDVPDENPKRANSLYVSIGVAFALLLFISLMLWFYVSKKKDGTYF